MLSRHYATRTKTTPIKNVEKELDLHPNKKIGVLLFTNSLNNTAICMKEVLSKNGNLKEALSHLCCHAALKKAKFRSYNCSKTS